MSITLISKNAQFCADNVSRIVSPKICTQAQLVGFYQWLDGHIRKGVDDANKILSAGTVVNTAPYDFTGYVVAKNRMLLAKHDYKKDNTVPVAVQEIFGKLFSTNTTPAFQKVELIQFLDSLVTLVGYDFEDDKKTLSRGDVAELVLMSINPGVAHEVNKVRL